MYDFFGLNAIVCERLTITLLHFLWQGAAIGIVAAVLSRMLLRASSQVRYIIHVAALTAMCGSLLVTLCLVNVSEQANLASESPSKNTAILTTSDALDSRSSMPVPMIDANPTRLVSNDSLVATDSVSLGQSISGQASDGRTNSEVSASENARYLPWLAPYVTALYFAGVALLLARLMRSAWLTRRMGRSASEVTNADLLQRMRTQAERLGLRVLPAMRWCQQVPMPVVIGVFRPIVLLPACAATGLTKDQLQAVIAHELAHIRRYDLLVNMLQRVIESLLFFHPAVWWVSRQIAYERELACDELVLTVGPGRIQYADALVRMAELSFQCGHPPLTALAATGSSTTAFKRRILKVLEIDTSPRIRPGRITAVVASMVVLLTLAMLIARGGALASGTSGDEDRSDSTENAIFEDERAAWRELDRLKVMIAGSGRTGWSVNLEQAAKQNDLNNAVKYQKLLDDIPTTADFWHVPSEAWPIIGRLRSLKDVRFVASDLQGQMGHLRQLQNLRKFELRSGQMLPDDLAELGGLINLQVIDVNLSTWFQTENEIAPLMAKLSEEDRRFCELDSDFNRTKHRLSMVLTDAAIAKLRNLKQLKVLDLMHTFVTGKGVEALAHLSNLEQFTVDDLHLLTPASMKALGSLPNLRRIPELPSGATELIEPLAGLRKLEVLRISGQDLTDEGLSHVKKLSSLKQLEILHCQVTDVGLAQLANLKRLEELDIRGVDRVTAAGVQQLRERLPNCTILRNAADYEALLAAKNEAIEVEGVSVGDGTQPPQYHVLEPRFFVRQNGSTSERPWEYEIDWPFDPKKIDHLRFRIRPYRHQFIFENVNIAPSQNVDNYTPFKVVHKKLEHDLPKPMAADEPSLQDRPRLNAESDAKARAELERLVSADPGHIHAMERSTRNPNGWKWTLYLPPGKTWRLYSLSGLIPSRHDIQPTGKTTSYPIVRKDEHRIIELEGFIGPNSRENGESQLWIEADRSILQGSDVAVWNIAPEVADYINGQTENSGSIEYFELGIGGVTTLNAGRDQFRLVLTHRRYKKANDKGDVEPELMPGFCVWVEADPAGQNDPAQANAYPQSIRGQAASPDPATSGQRPIELQVVDDITGAPIVGAEVTLRQTISAWQPERQNSPPVPAAVPAATEPVERPPHEELDVLQVMGEDRKQALPALIALLSSRTKSVKDYSFYMPLIVTITKVGPSSTEGMNAVAGEWINATTDEWEGPSGHTLGVVVYETSRYGELANPLGPKFVELLGSKNKYAAIWGAWGLVITGHNSGLGFEELLKHVASGTTADRSQAATALAALGNRSQPYVAKLKTFENDPDSQVAKQVREAIQRIAKDDRILTHKEIAAK